MTGKENTGLFGDTKMENIIVFLKVGGLHFYYWAYENRLLKLLYAGMLKASERWSHPVQNWKLTLSQLSIHFEGRLDDHIDPW